MAIKRNLPHFSFLFKKKKEKTEDAEDVVEDILDLRIIITKKIPRAVDRNRIKRCVREFCRLKRSLLPGNVVVCRVHPSAGGLKNAIIFKELREVL